MFNCELKRTVTHPFLAVMCFFVAGLLKVQQNLFFLFNGSLIVENKHSKNT